MRTADENVKKLTRLQRRPIFKTNDQPHFKSNMLTNDREIPMPLHIKVPYTKDGVTIEAAGTLMEVNEAKEPWAEYLFDDGSRMRVKQTLLQVVRLDEEKTPSGEPVYLCQMQPAITIIPKLEQ